MPTKIAWTDESWNPVTGCSPVSEGCKECYAEKLSKRFGWSWDVTLHPDRLEIPLRWRKPRRVFVPSMGDLFHEDVPDEFIRRVFVVMESTPRHTFQVLTKRPQRMQALVSDPVFRSGVESTFGSWPLPNVWLMVSVENQDATWRIEELMRTPAAVRGVSAEPLLGSLDLTRINLGIKRTEGYGDQRIEWNALTGWESQFTPGAKPDALPRASISDPSRRLAWVIVGGETSGPKQRYMSLDWARDLRDQCVAAGVPYFFKQASGPRPGMHRELDGAVWSQMPGFDGISWEAFGDEVRCILHKEGE